MIIMRKNRREKKHRRMASMLQRMGAGLFLQLCNKADRSIR